MTATRPRSAVAKPLPLATDIGFANNAALLVIFYLMLRPVPGDRLLYGVVLLATLTAAAKAALTPSSRLMNPKATRTLLPWIAVTTASASYGLFADRSAATEGIVTHVAPCVVVAVIALGMTRPMLSTISLRLPLIALVSSLVMIAITVYPSVPILSSLNLSASTAQGNFAISGSGIVSSRFHGISTLASTIPFLVTTIAQSNRGADHFGPKWIRYAALISSLIAVLISGRRGVFWAILGALALTLVFVWRSKARRAHRANRSLRVVRFGFVAVCSVTSLQLVASALGLNIGQVQRNFTSAIFEYQSGTLRNAQAAGLLERFSERPLLGWGLGSHYAEVPTAAIRPGRVELQYHQLLAHGGVLAIVGIGLSALLFARLARTAMLTSDRARTHLPPYVAAALGILVANATNPYLLSIGRYWPLCLCVAAVAYESPRRMVASVGNPDRRPATNPSG